jgi:predicted permease
MSLAAAATLAVGIGSAVAVVVVAYGALVRPLPVRDGDRLFAVGLSAAYADSYTQGVGLEELGNWRERSRVADGLAAWSVSEFTVRGGGPPEALQVAVVSDNFFDVIAPVGFAGRPFAGTDRDATAVASTEYAARLRRRGLEPIGHLVTAGAAPVRLAAVAPPTFSIPDGVDLWMPASSVERVALGSSADVRSFQLVARAPAGVDAVAVADDLARVLREIDEARGRPDSRRLRAEPLRDRLIAASEPALVAFVFAGAILLVVACANVATLYVSRAVRRNREFALRLAIGASPGRLARVALVESAIIAGAGALAGFGLAVLALRLAGPLTDAGVPRAATAALMGPAMLVAVALAATTTVLAGLAPALAASRAGFGPGLRTTLAIPPGSAGRRIRRALVTAQMALAVVLLVGAGLFARTVAGLLATDLGIDPGGSFAVRVRLTETARFDAGSQAPFVRETLRRVRELPGVAAAGFGSSLPPASAQLQFTLRVVTDAGTDTRAFDVGSATPGYFEAIGARLQRGRWFETADADRAPVAVISASAAAQLAPLGDPMDRELPFSLPGPDGTRVRPRVIGVIEDVRYQGLERPAQGNVYVPWSSLPTGLSFLIVRPASASIDLGPAVLRVLREVDPSLPLPEARTLADEVQRQVASRQMRLTVVGGISLAATWLAIAGLAGTLGRMVSERRRELAMRAVLGATPGETLRRVFTEGAWLIALGLAVGLAVSAGLARALGSLVYGVSPFDPITYVTVSAGLAALAAAAIWIPARRAAGVQPLELLRQD